MTQPGKGGERGGLGKQQVAIEMSSTVPRILKLNSGNPEKFSLCRRRGGWGGRDFSLEPAHRHRDAKRALRPEGWWGGFGRGE